MTRRVFISHAIEDQSTANELEAAFKRRGVNVWRVEDISVGTSISSAIQEAINNSDGIVVLISQSSINSNSVRHEISLAIAGRTATEKSTPVFPINIDGTFEAPFFLREIQQLDLRDMEGMDGVAAAVVTAIERKDNDLKGSTTDQLARGLALEEQLLLAERWAYEKRSHVKNVRYASCAAIFALMGSAAAITLILLANQNMTSGSEALQLINVMTGLVGVTVGYYFGRSRD